MKYCIAIIHSIVIAAVTLNLSGGAVDATPMFNRFKKSPAIQEPSIPEFLKNAKIAATPVVSSSSAASPLLVTDKLVVVKNAAGRLVSTQDRGPIKTGSIVKLVGKDYILDKQQDDIRKLRQGARQIGLASTVSSDFKAVWIQSIGEWMATSVYNVDCEGMVLAPTSDNEWVLKEVDEAEDSESKALIEQFYLTNPEILQTLLSKFKSYTSPKYHVQLKANSDGAPEWVSLGMYPFVDGVPLRFEASVKRKFLEANIELVDDLPLPTTVEEQNS